MANYPWKSRALCMFALHPDEVDKFSSFVEKVLVPDKIDTVVMIIRYNYMFISHPECRGDYPLSSSDVKKMVGVCKKHNINLVPDMNLLGHQDNQFKDDCLDGLLRAHPELDETPDLEKVEYCRSICPNHPDALKIVTDLMDEVADAFSCNMFHIGMDEVFEIGSCPRCRDKDPGEIFANWVNKLAEHLKKRGITTMMWGDRLLNSYECCHGPWDASQNGTWTALDKVSKDIIITDWHYHNWASFPSVDIFAQKGFKIYLCPFNNADNAKLFLDYAKEHDKGHILGIMETTWTPGSYIMNALLDLPLEDTDSWYKVGMPEILNCYKFLFR